MSRLLLSSCTLAACLTVLIAAPKATQAHAGAEARVEALLAQLTPAEKISMLGGGRGGFYTYAVPRLGIPALKMADGPMGVRNYGPSTAFPAGIALAATWDADLAHAMGAAMGQDARARDVNVLLAPAMDIYRIAINGRNFEYYGEDPYLAGQTAAAMIQGIQSQGVIATAKHFAANNQEYQRNSISSEVDERTLNEIYLPAFKAAVQQGHAWAVMSSYNKINGAYSTENQPLNDILKKTWGFQGILMSDWGATHDGVRAAVAGLDLEMPSPRNFNPGVLLPALADGRVTQAQIDDKVRRILRAAEAMGDLDQPAVTAAPQPKYSGASSQVALRGAREAIVLLQNQNHTLPLDRAVIHSIAVFGPNADPAVYGGGGSAHVVPFRATSLLAGLIAAAGNVRIDYIPFAPQDIRALAPLSPFTLTDGGRGGLNAEYFNNPDLAGTPAVSRIDAQLNFARFQDVFAAPVAAAPPGGGRGGGGRGGRGGGISIPFSARWTGVATASQTGDYDFMVRANRGFRLTVNNAVALDQWDNDQSRDAITTLHLEKDRANTIKVEFHSTAPGASLIFAWHPKFTGAAEAALAAHDDAAVIAAGFGSDSEAEGSDRSFTLPAGQDALIAAVEAANPRTAVVINSGGAVDMQGWGTHAGALLQAWYPGQEGGQALAEILFGDVNPSGKLPASLEKKWGDVPADATYPGADGKVFYKEGLMVGYRFFDQSTTKPAFPFGYGLSYTTFGYSGLSVRDDATAVHVQFHLKNTGTRAGAEVAQIYVQPVHPAVPRPIKELKAYTRVALQPGEERAVAVDLDRAAFSFYDVATHGWKVDPGAYRIVVGASSADPRLTGAVQIH